MSRVTAIPRPTILSFLSMSSVSHLGARGTRLDVYQQTSRPLTFKLGGFIVYYRGVVQAYISVFDQCLFRSDYVILPPGPYQQYFGLKPNERHTGWLDLCTLNTTRQTRPIRLVFLAKAVK